MKDMNKAQGTLRSAAQVIQIPFNHQVMMNPEIEKGNEKFKIQISLDKQAPGLPSLFPEITASLQGEELTKCRRQLTLRNHSGELISMLTSKDEMKIRL